MSERKYYYISWSAGVFGLVAASISAGTALFGDNVIQDSFNIQISAQSKVIGIAIPILAIFLFVAYDRWQREKQYKSVESHVQQLATAKRLHEVLERLDDANLNKETIKDVEKDVGEWSGSARELRAYVQTVIQKHSLRENDTGDSPTQES